MLLGHRISCYSAHKFSSSHRLGSDSESEGPHPLHGWGFSSPAWDTAYRYADALKRTDCWQVTLACTE